MTSAADLDGGPRRVAFYLPQYYPIPENDRWWGRGFTEWTNVARARPRFEGHVQPRLPADLGFYDLRVPEVREAQADLARAYGVHGFCYYHYWFSGRRLLGRPMDDLLRTGRPDLPFCLAWANASWTRAWDGSDDDVLIAQRYGPGDDLVHIRWLAPVFADPRYIRIEGKPLFLVAQASHLPDAQRTTETWRAEASRLGLGELFLARMEIKAADRGDPRPDGFDSSVEFQPDGLLMSDAHRILVAPGESDESPTRDVIYDYRDLVNRALRQETRPFPRLPCVSPGWDNSPRRPRGATIYRGSTPGEYERWVRATEDRQPRVELPIFINAWNEWAEGAHLEPCDRWGTAYLERHLAVDATRRVRRSDRR